MREVLSYLASPRPGAAAARVVLAPLSFLYRAGMLLHRAAARRAAVLPAPVVSVGQIHVGGAGKTPFVRALAARAAERGLSVGIVLRGHGGRASRRGLLAAGAGLPVAPAEEAGDEAVELARALSNPADGAPGAAIAVGRDRTAAARRILERTRVDLFLLDDAFQNWAAPRDLDVVLLPADSDPARERVLPAGPLREPYAALARADFVVAVADAGASARAAFPRPPDFVARRRPEAVRPIGGTVEPVVPLGRSVLLVSGIARPRSFEALVRASGATVADHLAFPDHHFFTPRDIVRIARRFEASGADFVGFTEKDAARLPRVLPFPAAAFAMGFSFDPPDALDRILDEAFARFRARARPRLAHPRSAPA